jgi:large subunit ribosomal protein L10
MNREQKAAAIAEIATNIDESQAIFAVDYRGITVTQVAELRAKLREADASFRVVKNSLSERAADQMGAAELKEYLQGPTALTFVRGDAALAAKAIADYARATQLLPFKGGLMDGATVDAGQIQAISRLPSREVLYGQLVGVVASPVTGLVRSLGALLGGLAVALGQVREKMQSGEIPSAAATPGEDAQAAPAEAPEAGTGAGEQAPSEQEPPANSEAGAEPEADEGEPSEAQPAGASEAGGESEAGGGQSPEPQAASEGSQAQDVPSEQDSAAEGEQQAVAEEPSAAPAAQDKTEPEQQPAQPDDEAEASSEAPTTGADQKPAKEA